MRKSDAKFKRKRDSGAEEKCKCACAYVCLCVRGNQRRWIDVSVRHPAAGTDADRTRAARKPGEASRRAERTKHERCPVEELTAFGVELPGRRGGEARE